VESAVRHVQFRPARDSLTYPVSNLLRKEPRLNLGVFHGGGAGFVIVSHSIKPTAFQPNSTLTATSNFE